MPRQPSPPRTADSARRADAFPRKWRKEAGGEAPPIAVPGLHEKFLPFFRQRVTGGASVLDIGCGYGSISARLHEAGYLVSACDLYPDAFRVPGVECRRADLADSLPFEDGAFDAAVAVEVTEHLTDHVHFFRECARVLRPGGQLLVTTPNVLSLKSRWCYLFLGYPYSFQPLDPERNDGEQHIASLTIDEYVYRARRAGLLLAGSGTDRRQNSSLGLVWLVPFLRGAAAAARLRPTLHNRMVFLLGRKLFLEFRKADPGSPTG